LVFLFVFSLFTVFNSKIHENSKCSRRTVIESGVQSYILQGIEIPGEHQEVEGDDRGAAEGSKRLPNIQGAS
jgi:hypothetical protein